MEAYLKPQRGKASSLQWKFSSNGKPMLSDMLTIRSLMARFWREKESNKKKNGMHFSTSCGI